MISVTCETDTRQYFGKYSGEVLPFDAHLPEESALRGDIRVKVPGILEEDAEGQPQPLEVVAKPSFLPGFFYIPEPGAKVWVEFVAGNIDYPIWTGVWYPDEQSPAAVTGEPPTRFQKVIRTASGHVVQLDDTEGEEAVTVLHKGGAEIKVDPDGSVLIKNQNDAFLWLNAADGETTLTDEHGSYVTLKADGVIVSNHQGNTFVELKDGKAKVVASDAITLVANEMVLESGSIALGSGATEPALLGNTFLTLFSTHTHATAMGPTGTPLPPLNALVAPANGQSTVVKVK
jgi:hypothetical protein